VKGRALLLGPPSYPYSPKCLVGAFSEVRIALVLHRGTQPGRRTRHYKHLFVVVEAGHGAGYRTGAAHHRKLEGATRRGGSRSGLAEGPR
jgi:hypothetical protein